MISELRRAHARHGIEVEPELVRHTLTRGTDAYETTRELLLADTPPPAIFMSQNLITIDAVRAIHQLGRRAAERQFARLDGDDGPSREIVIAPTLVERGSGELRPPAP